MPLDTEHDDDLEETDPEGPKGLRKALKSAEQRASELEGRATAAERKLAFLGAGIPDTPRNQYFINGYQGELDPEAIKAKAIEDGFLDKPEPKIPDGELEAHDELSQASVGGDSTPQTANDKYLAELAAARNESEALEVMRRYNVAVAQ